MVAHVILGDKRGDFVLLSEHWRFRRRTFVQLIPLHINLLTPLPIPPLGLLLPGLNHINQFLMILLLSGTLLKVMPHLLPLSLVDVLQHKFLHRPLIFVHGGQLVRFFVS